MIEVVCTEQQLFILNKIVEENYVKAGYTDIEKASLDNPCFMVKNEETNEYLATLELKPFFTKEKNEINKCFSFNELKELQFAEGKIFEISKLSIVEEHRSQGFLDEVFTLLTHFAIEHNVKYFIALVLPKLYKSLRRTYHIPVKRLTEKDLFYKGDDVTPIILDVDVALNLVNKMSWYNPKKIKDQIKN